MARHVHARLIINATLEAITPLHVGGFGESAESDLPLARNGADELYFPGTSLTGTLRTWFNQVFQEVETRAIWGSEEKQNLKSHASFVRVDDAILTLPETSQIEIRDSVRIDRCWGVAAEKGKYDRAVLPRGAKFELSMAVDIQKSEMVETVKIRFSQMINAIQQGIILFGAARTRGLGRVKVAQKSFKFHTLDNRVGMLQFLRHPNSSDITDEIQELCPESSLQTAFKLVFELDWKPKGPFMVKSGYDGIGVDMLPLVSQDGPNLKLVLPGSSIKGVLRNQAEKIENTVLGRIPTPNEETLSKWIFGSPNTSEPQRSGQKKKPQPGLGALAVLDCFAATLFTRQNWSQVEQATQESLQSALSSVAAQKFSQAFHIAIDRWTGGVSQGALFTVLEPFHFEWEHITFTLDFSRLEAEIQLPALTLVLLVMRDVMLGQVPFGYGVNRGMGEAKIRCLKLSGSSLDSINPVLLELNNKKLTNPDLSEISETLLKLLNQQWKEWIAKSRKGK